MELKRTVSLKVKENKKLDYKFFKETSRTLTNETRTVYVKKGENPITYSLEIVEGVFYSSLPYETIVRMMIREKYDINEELAIQRQRDTKPSEFQEYFDYIESIKTLVKDFITERETLFDLNGNLKASLDTLEE